MAERAAQSGFSLIEVMVALAVFAVAALALINAGAAATRHAGHVETRMMAGILAENLLVERIAARRAGDIGATRGVTDLSGRRFSWAVRTMATDAPGLLKIEIDVVDEASGQLIASLSGFRRAR